MRKSNQHTKAQLRHTLWGMAFLTIAACTAENTIIGEGANDDLMRFNTTLTRAVINDINTPGQTMGMSGLMCANGKDTLQVFANQNQKAEFTSTVWNYTPMRYWHNSYEYLFVAYAPYRAEGVTMDKGRLTIADYSALDQIDLMASAPVMRDPGNRTTVKFQFSHLLTQINVVIKSSSNWGSEVKLTDFKIKGMYTEGTFTQGATQEWTTVNTPYNDNFFTAPYLPKTLTPDGTQVITNLLAIPQLINTNVNIRFEIEYQNEDVTYNKEIVLALAGAITPWQKGETLTYTMTLSPNNIEFAPPQVKPWVGSMQGGSFVVM